MNYNKLIAALLFAGMLTLSGCGGGSDSTDTTTTTEEAPATEVQDNTVQETETTVTEASAPVTNQLNVTTITGETITVQVTTEGFKFVGYEGKPVLLEFYGDTCPHCIDAIPTYNTLQQKYGNNVLILTIDDGNQYTTLDNSGLQAFAASHGIIYKTVSRENSGNLKAFAEAFVGTMPGVPYVLVLNKEGTISTHMLGPNEAQLEAALYDVL